MLFVVFLSVTVVDGVMFYRFACRVLTAYLCKHYMVLNISCILVELWLQNDIKMVGGLFNLYKIFECKISESLGHRNKILRSRARLMEHPIVQRKDSGMYSLTLSWPNF